MKRTGIVLLLGLSAGLVVHNAWYAARAPDDASDLQGLLDGMRKTLQLDAEQFARFRELHEILQPQLDQLAADVGELRAQFAGFEQERRATGEIDFLAYASLIEKQRVVDRECTTSTQDLVHAALADMTPEQGSLYMSLLAPVIPDPGTAQIN